MGPTRKWLTVLLLSLFVCTVANAAGTPAEEARKMAPRIKDYFYKHQIIQIGLPAVEPLFEQLAQPKDDTIAFETRSALRWIAENAAGSAQSKAKLLDALKQKIKAGQPAAVRGLAVELLAVVGGKEAASVIAPLLSDEAVRDAACAALTQIPGSEATKSFVDACEKAPPEFRCALLHALGVRRDPAGLEAVKGAMGDKNEEVSLAAINALGMMGDWAGVLALENALKTGSNRQKAAAFEAMIQIGNRSLDIGKTEDAFRVFGVAMTLAPDNKQRAAAIAGLGRTGDPKVEQILDNFTRQGVTVDPAVKSAAQLAYIDLADALWERERKDQASSMVLKALDMASDEAAQVRALIGCGRAGKADSIPKMASLLKSGSPRVQSAAASAIKLIPGNAATEAMATALPSAPPSVQAVLLTALGERGDPNVVSAMSPLATSANEEVALAAIKALGGAGSAAAQAPLVSALEKGSDRVKSEAIDSCLRLAGALIDKGEPENAAQVYCRVLDFAADEAIRAQVFGGLQKVPSLSVAEKISGLVEKEKGEAREQAVKALLACADKVFASERKDASKPVYQAVLKAAPVGSLEAAQARYGLSKLGEKPVVEAKDGVVGYWWVIGSWSVREPKDWKKPQGPENDKRIDLNKEFKRGSRVMRWMPVMTDDKNGALDMNRLFVINDECLAYCYAEIVVDREQDVNAEVQSDDGHILLVNGTLAHEFLKDKKREKKDDAAKLHLKAGANPFLLKSCDCSGNWTFSVRLTDAEGKPLKFKIQ